MSKGQRTRREIVNQALTRAGAVGLEHVTLGTLAADLQLSKSGLFAHFRSKEALQLAVLAEAIERFTADVVQPAFAAPRGEPRVVALFDRQLAWIRATVNADGTGGRCIFMALSQEYDDRPGEVRDAVVRSQRDWRAVIARATRLAVSEGHFRRDLDAEQVAFELVAITMAYQQTANLLHDADAERRARTAFAGLIERCRARAPETRP